VFLDSHGGGRSNELTRSCQRRAGDGSVLARGGVVAAFIAGRKTVGVLPCAPRQPAVVWPAAWPEYGGKGRRCAAAVGQWQRLGGAAWPARTHHVAQPRTHRCHTQGPRSTTHGPLGAGRPRHVCTAGTAARRRGQARAARLRRACGALWLWHNFKVALFE
jgi:hypothetical protein